MLKSKKGISRIALILIVALVVIIGAVAVVFIMNRDKNGNINNQLDNNSKDVWGLKINGKNITLPCTLADLATANVHIYNEDQRETILSTPNKTFTMISAVCGDGIDSIQLKIETGNNINKREDNATVKIITNTDMNKDLFTLKNNIGLGSSLNDVINAFGNNYTVTGKTDDDLNKGYTVITYGSKSSGVMFNFEDGILQYIELLAD